MKTEQPRGVIAQDEEVAALVRIGKLLSKLPPDAQARIVRYLEAKYLTVVTTESAK